MVSCRPMKAIPQRGAVRWVQLGAGQIGRHLGPLVAAIPGPSRARLIDRDVFTKSQAWKPADAARPKAEVVAEAMRIVNPQLKVETLVGNIENLPLGLFRCQVLLTALDSKRSRMAANYAFRKLAIPYWVDSGISAPALVRITTFAQGQDAPCYECALDSADYASEQSYPCQPEFTPPPTNSPAYLGALAASLQAAECARLLSGPAAPESLNRELIYHAATHRLVLTRLKRLESCRLDHDAFSICPLSRSPARVTLADAFALGTRGTSLSAQAAASLGVPGKLFVRELACRCGARRTGLRLGGRFGAAAQTCTQCGARMSPTGSSLTNVLARRALSPRDLAKPLSALGLQPGDVIAINAGARIGFFELGSS